jgi:hypothetical protein
MRADLIESLGDGLSGLGVERRLRLKPKRHRDLHDPSAPGHHSSFTM